MMDDWDMVTAENLLCVLHKMKLINMEASLVTVEYWRRDVKMKEL
jgi:hypothetical protein